MPLDNRKNFAKATVSTGYDASAVSIVLASGHGARLPSAPFNATWWNFTDYADPGDDPNAEIVRVTGIATDTLTITRAQETTSASTKNSGGKTYRLQAGLTKKTIDDIDARTAVVQLAYASTINSNAALGSTFEVASLTGPVTIANPTGMADGQVLSWLIQQDGTGGRTVALGSKFVVPSSATLPLAWSTAPNATDVLVTKYRLSADKHYVVGLTPGY